MAASFCRRSFLNYKKCLFHIQKRTGYVVLIPETTEEAADCKFGSVENLPDFSNFNSKKYHLITAKFARQFEVGMYELNEYLEKNKNKKIDIFKELFEPIEVLSVPFDMSFGIATALFFSNSKHVSAKTYYSLSDRVCEIKGYKHNLKSVYTRCKERLEAGDCTEEQKRILQKYVWEGMVNGIDLKVEEKEAVWKSFTAIELNKRNYETRWTSAKNFFQEIITDEKFAEDCPLDLLRQTSRKWDKPLQGPWIINLNKSVYERFLEFYSLREARFHIWMANNQLCSGFDESVSKATMFIEQLRDHRFLYAKNLGFPTYADLVLKNKMAGSVENVQNFLSDLLEPAKYAQEKEVYKLEKFAYLQGSRVSLEMWDFSFWRREYLKYTCGIDELTLRDYFPLGQVLLGLVALCEQLFGIEIEEQQSFESGWNSDVRYFRILDEKTKAFLGGFYLDPYGHSNKVTGDMNSGWFVAIRPKSKFCNSLPLSALIFSFEPPDADKPSLLYLRDLNNLFEKFGMMLQFTLTEMNYSDVSGMSNLEWDTYLISRYFLQSWLTDRHTLESISGHYDSGEPLPPKILNGLSKINNVTAGTDLSRMIYRANLDLGIYTDNKESCLTLMKKLWPQHFLFKLADTDYHCYSFSEVFSGPLAACYYSFLWSRMLAADVFMNFREVGLDNQEEISALGRRFRSTFFALGGGCDPKEVFRRFRGRDPNPKMLLKLLDIKEPPQDPAKLTAVSTDDLIAAEK